MYNIYTHRYPCQRVCPCSLRFFFFSSFIFTSNRRGYTRSRRSVIPFNPYCPSINPSNLKCIAWSVDIIYLFISITIKKRFFWFGLICKIYNFFFFCYESIEVKKGKRVLPRSAVFALDRRDSVSCLMYMRGIAAWINNINNIKSSSRISSSRYVGLS